MKIEKFKISRLFGTFDYEIDLLNSPNPLIITGLNGYGKTTLLTIIDRLSKKDLFYFYILPFEGIHLSFHDATIRISSDEEQDVSTDESVDTNLSEARKVTFEWLQGGDVVSSLVIDKKGIQDAVRKLGFYRRTELYPFTSYTSDGFYSFVQSNPEIYSYYRNSENAKALFLMLDRFQSTFVQAQRVLVEKVDAESVRRPSRIIASRISDVSQSIKEILRESKYSYLRKSQEVDKDVITQLLDDPVPMKEEDYNNLKAKVEEKIRKLELFNLIGKTQIKPYEDQNSRAWILTVYLKNLNQKLGAFDDLLPKLSLFNDLINSLELVNKSVSYSESRGLDVKSKDGKFLDVNKLSSGEQNELIMIYYMIFEVKDHSVLLLDEPEISLHVAWQNTFIDNLQQIAETKDLQVIVATHSPQIIGDRWEDCYDLCEHCHE